MNMDNSLVKIEDYKPVKISIRRYFDAKTIQEKYALQAYDAYLQGQIDLFRMRLQAYMNWQRDEILIEGQRILAEKRNQAIIVIIEQAEALSTNAKVNDPYKKALLKKALDMNVELFIQNIWMIGGKSAITG